MNAEVTAGPGSHSKVGASSKKRWTICPGSVKQSEGMPNHTSFYAAEGTVAHWIGEECLKSEARSADEFLGMEKVEDGHKITISQEMCDAVEVYLDAVDKVYDPETDTKLVENRFHCTELHEAMYGTNDCCIYKPLIKTLYVFDYKHGAGVAVNVFDNEQLKYYAVGALMGHSWPVEKIVIVIVQPRCDHSDGPVREFEISPIDLLEWTFQLVKDINATEDPDAPLVPSEECRWCKGAVTCPELVDKAMAAAQSDFKVDDASYDPERIADLLDEVPHIEAWCKVIREFAYAEAEHGRCPPRHKLVAKRATRRLIDIKKVASWLIRNKVSSKKALYEQVFIPDSPAKVEKLLDKDLKAKFAKGKFVSSESSGCVLVPESDKRAAVKRSAEEDFSTTK